MFMDLLRQYIWLWVIIGVIFLSVVISLIFVLINKCIYKQEGKRRISLLQRSSDFSVQSNKYQEKNFDTGIPPLPPRTQFLTAEAQSYENLAEVPDYEEATEDVHDYEENVDSVHDYEENVDSVHDYEENLDAQPDYVKVEEEEVTLSPPPPLLLSPPSHKNPDPATDDSGEDYDDIGEEEEEDYDDVA